jgi:hypothetical protein
VVPCLQGLRGAASKQQGVISNLSCDSCIWHVRESGRVMSDMALLLIESALISLVMEGDRVIVFLLAKTITVVGEALAVFSMGWLQFSRVPALAECLGEIQLRMVGADILIAWILCSFAVAWLGYFMPSSGNYFANCGE